jgi:aminotransferase
VPPGNPAQKILMLNLPCNPTGGTCDREQLEQIAAFCREKDLLVMSDEIYSELTFEGTHTSIASLPGMAERTIFLHGFSKAFAMTGWRIGYACGPAPLIDAMMKVHQYTMLCARSSPRKRRSKPSSTAGTACSRCANNTTAGAT